MVCDGRVRELYVVNAGSWRIGSQRLTASTKTPHDVPSNCLGLAARAYVQLVTQTSEEDDGSHPDSHSVLNKKRTTLRCSRVSARVRHTGGGRDDAPATLRSCACQL